MIDQPQSDDPFRIDLNEELNNAIDTSNIQVKWFHDPKGYFIIKPFHSRKRVYVRCYDIKGNLKHTLAGNNTSQLIQEIIERKLISRLDHVAYLGREIEKAMIALKYNLKYSQDEDLLVHIKM